MNTRGTPKIGADSNDDHMLLDHRNIIIGKIRVVWAKACGVHFEGWVLPGGQRTKDPERARACAVQMDAITRGFSK